MFRAMNYKEFKQRMRRQLGMKKHRILREHASISDRHTHPGNRRVEKAEELNEHCESRKDMRCGQQNNQLAKVTYNSLVNLKSF